MPGPRCPGFAHGLRRRAAHGFAVLAGMANLENLAVFALPPSEALGRAVAEDYGLVIAPHELRQFEDGEHKIRPLRATRRRPPRRHPVRGPCCPCRGSAPRQHRASRAPASPRSAESPRWWRRGARDRWCSWRPHIDYGLGKPQGVILARHPERGHGRALGSVIRSYSYAATAPAVANMAALHGPQVGGRTDSGCSEYRPLR
jgi:hypothetical protein